MLFITAFPFNSSDPILSNATHGFSLSYNALCKAEPIIEKSIKFFELHSMLAPKSKTTFIPFLLGHNADRAGLSIFSIIFKFSFDIKNSAPVLPAETIAWASSFFKDSTGVVTLTVSEAKQGQSLIQKADAIKIDYDNLPTADLNVYLNNEIRSGQFVNNPKVWFKLDTKSFQVSKSTFDFNAYEKFW